MEQNTQKYVNSNTTSYRSRKHYFRCYQVFSVVQHQNYIEQTER